MDVISAEILHTLAWLDQAGVEGYCQRAWLEVAGAGIGRP